MFRTVADIPDTAIGHSAKGSIWSFVSVNPTGFSGTDGYSGGDIFSAAQWRANIFGHTVKGAAA